MTGPRLECGLCRHPAFEQRIFSSELDFRGEADNAARFAENFQADASVRSKAALVSLTWFAVRAGQDTAVELSAVWAMHAVSATEMWAWFLRHARS